MSEKYPMNCHKAKQYDQIWVNLMTVHVYSEISNQSKSETYKPYIIGLIGLAISKEAWFIHKPLDRSHSYAAVFTPLCTRRGIS